MPPFGRWITRAPAYLDPTLVGRITALEMSATGSHQTFAPALDLPCDLRWGRVDESYGEDPLLIGAFGESAVRGSQGDSLAVPAADR